MYEVVIIGSGPAGLAATMYCIRKGMDVQLVAGHMGGKASLNVTFPEMTRHHIFKAREQVQVFRARIEYLTHTWRADHVKAIAETPEGFEIELAGGGAIGAERLIIATGVHATPLGVPGENKFLGKALGSSALSYTHALRDRTAVIIGNSDRAIEGALEASLQAGHVHLVLEERARFSHRHLELARDNDRITVHTGCEVVRFEGDDYARSVTIRRVAGAGAEAPAGAGGGGASAGAGATAAAGGGASAGTGADAAAGAGGGAIAGGGAAGAGAGASRGEEERIEADGFFVERDPRPRSEVVAHLVECTPDGAIRINEQNETSNKRIFAAGDVTNVGVEQILVALGEGARAGLSAYRHMTMQV